MRCLPVTKRNTSSKNGILNQSIWSYMISISSSDLPDRPLCPLKQGFCHKQIFAGITLVPPLSARKSFILYSSSEIYLLGSWVIK